MLAFQLYVLLSMGTSSVRVMELFGDGMVLQAASPDGPVATSAAYVFGTGASATTTITLRVTSSARTNSSFQAVVLGDAEGSWRVALPGFAAGGPYELLLAVAHERAMAMPAHVARNVYFGEVFLCSGQSNMEFPVSACDDAAAQEAAADAIGDAVRFWSAPDDSTFPAQSTLPIPAMRYYPAATSKTSPASKRWRSANRTSAADFSALCWMQVCVLDVPFHFVRILLTT